MAKGASCDMAASHLGHHPAALHPRPLLGYLRSCLPLRNLKCDDPWGAVRGSLISAYRLEYIGFLGRILWEFVPSKD